MIIYRVENERGMGPYSGEFATYDEVGLPFKGSPKHPAPYDDGLSDPRLVDRFGFRDLLQLVDWFDLWLDGLESAGFRVVRINTWKRYVIFGNKQLMFEEREQVREIVPWSTVRGALLVVPPQQEKES